MFSTQVVIGDILPRTQAIAIASQTVFGTNWTANYTTDVIVYLTPAGDDADDATQQVDPSQYTVAFIGSQQQVQVTLVTPADAGDIITITRMTPADRTNLYTNTNFTPSMLNQDFGILTLVDQQAQLVDQLIGPRYNYSGLVIDGIDNILPVLGSNQIWAKNPSNTEIIAVDLNQIISGGTVTQINTGLGLTGGPITSAGTISFAPMNANTFWGNITGSTALPSQVPTTYFLKSANNLSDLTNVTQAQINLALQPGVNVQAYSAALTSIAGLSTVANNLLYTTGVNTYALISPAANSVLVTNGSNVPSLSMTLPSNVQINITQLGAQTQALNMNAHLINNVTDPVAAQDAATKNYVDTMGGAFLPLAGGTMSGQINMNSHKIINLTNPSSAGDAANKAYVDSTVGSFLPLSGGTMSGVIDMGNNKIINVTDPTLNQDAVNLQYLNTQLALYLPLSGGTMTGAINMNSHKITSVTDPTNPQDAATKNYVDSVAVGLDVVSACAVATTANLTATYLNGASGIGATLTNSGALAALVIDGISVSTNDRVLVKDQSTTFQNGIYTVTNAGSGAVAWILTRATDYDQPSEIKPGTLVVINTGTVNALTSWLETATVSAVGTDPVLFSQFTFAPSAFLLKSANLSDVANTTTSFNNISPLTTKGDLIAYSTQNIRVGVGADGTILQASSAATPGIAWTTATYPTTTTANQILYSSATNTISGLSTTAGGVLITDASSVPQFLANPAASGKVLQSVNGAASAWSTPTYPSTSGTSGKFLISDGTNNVYSTSTIPTSAGATAGKIIVSDGTNYVLSTPTFPNASASARKIIVSDGTNWVASTETYATPGTSGNIMTSDGTNWTSAANAATALLTTKGDLFSFSTVPARLPVASGNGKVLQVDSTASTGLSYSTPTYPSTSGTSGKVLISDGTNNVYSTSTFPTSAGATANKVLLSDGTNYVLSTPTFPNASASSGKFIRSDGTNWIASTPTLPTSAGTSGKVLQSNGTNYVESTPTYPSASGTSRTMLVSDGTNIVYSTETWAVPGTSGNVLTSDGTNWTSAAPAGGGAWVKITRTVASSSASVTFSSLVTTYQAYAVVFTTVIPATDSVAFQMTYNAIAANYDWAVTSVTAASGGGAGNGGNNGAAAIQLSKGSTDVKNSANAGINGILYMPGPNTSNMQMVNWNINYMSTATTPFIHVDGGARNSGTTAINSITFKFSSGNISSGVFELYGLVS